LFNKHISILIVSILFLSLVSLITKQLFVVQQGITVEDALNSWSANWVDYNNDGFDDLYVPSNSKIQFGKLYENENGIIICLDADCLIEVNYFRAIESHFKASPECPAVSIDFAHRLDEFEPKQKIAIEKYERYLRDIISQQRAAGYPYAFHTIGSAMAVRSSDYMKQGGMNRRKAGEDFYFIHKFTSNPHFAEIKTTRVLPSARISDRVPFGTGRAIGDCLEQKKDITFYSPQTFRDLGALIQGVPAIYGMDDSQLGEWKSGLSEMLRQFLEKYDFDYNWKEMLANSSSEATFRKRFFQWLNPFLVMKMMNFARVFYPDKKDVKDV